jgi:GTP:adenosylcobinamide-phosphate guanylyltransferase
LDALILAGEQPETVHKELTNKALLPIHGKAMIEYVVEALLGSGLIHRIVVAGPKKTLEQHLCDKPCIVIDSAGSILDHIQNAIQYLGFKEPIIVCSSDIPMLTPGSVADFIMKALELHVDFCYPIVEKAVNDRLFPEMQRTYVKIREGRFTGGNLVYVDTSVIIHKIELIRELVNARKKPHRMARLIGWGVALQLLLGRISIQVMERKVSKILGINVRAVISEYPEIGSDVDKPSDFVIAEAYLGR